MTTKRRMRYYVLPYFLFPLFVLIQKVEPKNQDGGVAQQGQVDEPATAGKGVSRPPGRLDRQPRLPDAARPGHRQERRSRRVEERAEPFQLGRPPDERREGGRPRERVRLRRDGHGARPCGRPAGRGRHGRAFRRPEVQPRRQQANRLPLREASNPALEVADAARAQPGALGQGLLGEAGGHAVPCSLLPPAPGGHGSFRWGRIALLDIPE